MIQRPRPLVLATLLCAAGLAVASTGCTAPVFEAAARAQMLTLGGDFGASTTGITATSDVDSLGLGDDQYVFSPRIDAEFGPWHVTGDAFLSSLDGQGTVDADLSIGNIDLNVGEAVETAIDLGYARAIATFDLVPSDTVDLGIGVGLVLADVDADIEDVVTGQRESVGEVIVGPVAALHGRVKLGRFDVGVAASGIAFDVSDVDVTHFDVDASARFEALTVGGLALLLEGGYRYLLIEAAFDDASDHIDASLDYAGPYAGLRISF